MQIKRGVNVGILVIIAVVLLTGCAAHTSLEPVGGGKTAVQVSTGFPPSPVAIVRHGITDQVDISGGLQLGGLEGFRIGTEFGLAVFPFVESDNKRFAYPPVNSIRAADEFKQRPVFGIQANLSLVGIEREKPLYFARITPTLSLTSDDNWMYLGADLGVMENLIQHDFNSILWLPEPTSDQAVVVAPFFGGKRPLSDHMNLGVEVKIMYMSNTSLASALPLGLLYVEWH